MKRPFCFICGREGSFPNHRCPDCSGTLSSKETVHGKNEVAFALSAGAPQCPSCGRVYLRGRWQWRGEGTTKLTCPDCHKLNSGVFTAVIQVPSTVRLDKVIETELDADRRHGKFSALVAVEGNEFRFSNVSIARRIARKSSKKFGLRVKETAKLIGYDARGGKGRYKVSFFLSTE